MFNWPELLAYWFGELDDYGLPDQEHRERWFRSSRGFDQEIRRRFMSLVLLASENNLEHWRANPGGRLAEILLLDQFPRHVYRGGELAFSHDRQAARLCLDGLEANADQELLPIQRAFFYMPLQHAEKREHQALSVRCFEALAAGTDGPLGVFLESFAQSARDHQAVVERFGRFPHRNQALRRPSTPEERVYLAHGGSRYGQ